MDIELLKLIFETADSGIRVAQGANELSNADISMPNIPFATMGGKVFWNTLAERNGYKLQQNMITQHARILNSDDVRVAWGTVSGMEKQFIRLTSGGTIY